MLSLFRSGKVPDLLLLISAKHSEKGKYEKAFIAKLSDSEGEAAETQNWLDYSLDHGYISQAQHHKLDKIYDNIIGKLVRMATQAEKWSF